MKWQTIRYFLKSLFYGVASYCIFFTFDFYFVMPYSKNYNVLNLTCMFFWIAIVTLPLCIYYTAKIPRENKGEYDYENGKLVFKEEDHS